MTPGAGSARPDVATSLVTRFTFPLRFLGFGFYWAWMSTFWSGAAASPLGMPTMEQTTAARIAVQAVTALAFIAAALFARRLTSGRGERLLVLGGAILGPVGTIVAALGHRYTGGGIPAYLALAWASLGIACACITLLWGRFYASVGLKRASIYTPLSLILAAIIVLILASMQPLVAIVIATLLPLVSVGMFLLASPEPAPVRTEKLVDHRQPKGALWRISIAIGVYGATIGFYLHSLALFGKGGPPSIAGKVVALLVPLVIIVLLRKKSFGLVLRLTLPLTAAGFLLLPILGISESWIGAVVVSIGFTFFDIITWIALAEIAHRGGSSPIRVFGFGRAANAGGIALGWAASYALLGIGPGAASTVLAFSLAMVFLLILTTTVILKEEDFPAEEAEASSPLDRPDDQPAPGAHPHAGRWRRCCARISREHGLSPREEEVMVLLAKGHTMKHIEETLFVSYATAKSHANHIYKKLGVHSREELINVVETQFRPGSPKPPESTAGPERAADHRVGPATPESTAGAERALDPRGSTVRAR
jgi:DNA-binding CsgD family transcriptional regulator